MHHNVRTLCLLPLLPLLAQCGSSGSDSGVAASPGTTRFAGDWTLVATINVNIGGTATVVNDTSEVVVGADGNVVVRSTDSECGLDITVRDELVTYQAQCVFTAAGGDSDTAACTLNLVSRATIRGTPGSASLSGTFGPDTEVCRGVAASYSGNLIGNQPEDDDGGGDDNGNNGDDV